MKSRIHRFVWIALVGFITSLTGPVAPASAAASSIQVVGQTVISPSKNATLGVGDSLTIHACFEGEVARSGGGNGDVKLTLNSKAGGVAWAGTRATSAPAIPGVTNNCLVFVYTVAGGDTSQVGLQATGITLANSATLTITGRDTIDAATTTLTPSQNVCGAGPCGGMSTTLAVDVTAPTSSAVIPADNAASQAAGGNFVLTTNERVVSGLSVQSRSCAGGTATVVAVRDHDIAVGDLLYASLVGPGYDSGTGSMTYFRVTAVTGRNISYAVACTNEALAPASGALAPLRYITVAEDADTAKNLSNLAIASNVATLTSNGHGFEVGDTVVIEGAATAGGAQPQINGAFVVLSATANTFTVNLTRANAALSSNVANTPDVGSVAASAGTARRVIEAIPAFASNVVASSVSPYTVTIDPAGTLPGSTALHVRVQAGALRDTVGNSYVGITDATTWNFGTGVAPASITNITSSTADGLYRTGGGTNPSIQVRFNQNVTVDTSGGTPRLTLNSGSGAVAAYASGSGGKVLTFTYTLGAGHSTLNQLGKRLNVTGLDLNGGTISGVGPSIAVPASGATGSLNANKNIVIDNTAPTPMGFQPFPGAVGVQATSALTVMFPENVTAVATKKLYIKTLVPHTPATITTASLTSNVATITTSAAHRLAAGNTVVIAGASNAAYNGTFQVASVPSATTFTVAKTNVDIASAAVGGTATRTIWETITLTTGDGGNVSVTNFPGNSGAAATITRAGVASTVNLVTEPATNYYVEAEAGAFADLAGNTTAALTGSSIWFFEASPDTVAPVFQPNQSDPPHTMGTFEPSRSIQLAFSEAVSTVAAKTIKLCTGDAGCATPVETFTFPSSLVTSLAGGMRIQIDPTDNLLPSTSYFLLIDSGAFQDGAGNATATAVTAGQYQFTTMTPGMGGGGGGTSCGPPPLPPCNVGPGINFGPGGMIQNPGAIGGSDMANLRPDNFMGFRPDDARNLGAGALQNFRPEQFGALPPTAMGGFNRDQINNLNPAAMAGMNRDQLRALPPEAMQGFRPDQFAQLPPSAIAGMDRTQFAALPPTAMQGFNANQMAQLPPTAMAAFDPTRMAQLPPTAMQGFDPTKMAALPPAAMQGFNANQMAQLPPAAMAALDPTKMRQLPPSAVAGFRPEQMAALPPEAMRVFDPSKMQNLPPAAMAGFDPSKMQALPPQAMAVMNQSQLGQMPPAAFGVIQPQQFNVLSPTAMQGFKPELMAALPPTMVQNFKPEQFAALPPAAMGGLNEDRFRALPPQAMTAFNPQQMGAVPAAAMEGMRVAQFSAIPPSAMQGFNPSQFAALPLDTMQSFKPTQMAALPPLALAGMEPEQIRVLPPTAARALNPEQVGALPPQAIAAIPPGVFRAFSAAAIAALTPEQRNALPPQALNPPPLAQPATAGNIGALVNSLSGWNIDKVPPAAFTGMKPTDVAKLPADAFTALSANQFGSLPPAAFSGLKPNQVELLPPEAVAALKPLQLGQLPPNAFAAFSPAQVGALPPSALAAMKPTQTGQLPPEAFEVMKPSQVGALPPSAVGGLKPDQVAALSPDALTALKPAQVGALKPTAVAALEPQQVAALPPSALTQMKPTQAAALPVDAIAEMKPTQVSALPPAAVGGLKPEQVSALPPEAMTAMKPAQVAALKPAAVGGLEPAQVDALPPAALRQVSGPQLGAISADAMKSLDTAQINALPSTAFKGMKPEQANSLSPDQARAMSPQDVAQMPPAVRSIVNNLKAQPPTGT